MEKPAAKQHSSLLGPFVTYELNKVLLIRARIVACEIRHQEFIRKLFSLSMTVRQNKLERLSTEKSFPD